MRSLTAFIALVGLFAIVTTSARGAAVDPGLGGGILTGDPYRSLEDSLARELSKSIGPADRWEVKLARTGNQLLEGRFSRLDIHGVNIRTPAGLVVSDVALTLENVKMDLQSGFIEDVGNGLFTGRLD